ncbi:MAG TPA: LCCL domain-containing protein [Candidatus Limnocylindria bacterium]|nr:LCCL domain-containing protein [Candidatus Limnocylindria bacterium]
MQRWLAMGAIVFAVVACGGGPSAPAGSATPTAPPGGPPTATDGVVPTAGGSGLAGDYKTCHPGWATNAQQCSIKVGDRLMLNCPSVGTIRYVWGTDTYTADSSVCTAAVHAGLIGVDAGGDVYFQIAAGQEHYAGSERNGVTSGTRGEWLTSFQFIDAPAP